MSEPSPFRTEGNKDYRWPPAPTVFDAFEQYKIFNRVTHVLDRGMPRPFDMIATYASNKAAECFTDNAGELLTYLVRESFINDSQILAFPPDQQWWDKEITDAKQKLEDATVAIAEYLEGNPKGLKRKPNQSHLLKTLMLMSPVDKAARYISQAPKRHSRFTADRGTVVHNYLERLALGEVIYPEETEFPDHVRSGISFFEEVRPQFVQVECVVYSEKYRYAGQSDGIAKVPVSFFETRKQWNSDEQRYEPWVDRRNRSSEHYDPDFVTVLIDWKTGDKGIKESVPYQLAAYYYADFIGNLDGTTSPIPHCDEFWGVNITGSKWSITPLTVNSEVFDTFLTMQRMSNLADQRQPQYLPATQKFLNDFVPSAPSLEVL